MPTSSPGSGPAPTPPGRPPLALTFDPPPVALLRPDAAPAPLTWIDRRVELMKAAGATEVGVFQTGPWLLGLTAREFFDRVILGQLGARGMVEGPTFGFGRDRGGDAALLGPGAPRPASTSRSPRPTEVDGRIVSSSRIRRALAEGRGRRGRPPPRPPPPDPRARHPRRGARGGDRRARPPTSTGSTP